MDASPAAPLSANEVPLALQVAREAAGLIASPQHQRFSGQLTDLAACIARLPGAVGALVVAFDEAGDPLTSGAQGLELPPAASPLEALSALCQELGSRLARPDGFPVPPEVLPAPGAAEVWGLPLGQPQTVGLLLVAASPEEAGAVQNALREGQTILAAAVQSFLKTEAWNRIERLQNLARKTFGKQDWSLDKLPWRLARLFHADAVTILVEEHGELRLGASTDPRLGKETPVVYRPGKGLTGSIFASGRSLRLSNTQDSEEIWRSARIRRAGPLFPELDENGGHFSGQFLGVPMLFGGRVVGVLRMSRRGGAARFTAEDEKALQFFAELLGAALAPSWPLLVANSVFESVSEAIAVSRHERDADGNPVSRIVTVNAGAQTQLGLGSPAEIQGRDVREVYAPGEYERVREGLLKKLAEAKVRGRAEYGPVSSCVRRKDGALVPVRISYRILANRRVSPPSLYTMGLARETSQSERLAEQHQRILQLLDTFSVVYFQADRDGWTQQPNATESQVTGYSLAELSRMKREQLFADPKKRADFIKETREHEGRLARRIQKMKRKDGTTFWAEGDIRIVRDSAGNETGVEGLYRDRTDRIQLQGFLNADTDRVLEDSELFEKLQADAEFHLNYLMSLGHQLQTPLGSLVETLRNFEKGVTDVQRLAERLPYVIGQAVVCSRLVRNLSYMDKILRGEAFEREPVTMAKLAIETRLDFVHLAKEKRLDLLVDDASFDRHLPRVQGHRELLRQVFVNLVDNAIKYSLPGTEIRVRARLWPGGPALEISNQGFPIREEDREKIFQRGFRTRQAQALVPHGTGLGLWLVRKIVEAHGASIRCLEESEEGQKRILFRILFPHSAPGPRRSS
jgi:PAS domain S-box-containing protein